MPRAIVFDLDNTLYPEPRFVLSGFREVARDVSRRYGVPAGASFACLCRALRSGHRAEALQALCRQFDLPDTQVEDGVTLIRGHRPSLRLPRASAETLRELRPAWRIGILTNGPPDVQGRKIDALGLRPLVDEVVCAGEEGRGKPDAAPFLRTMARLGVPPERGVMVGDDPWCDIYGARRAGLLAIELRRERGVYRPGSLDIPPDLVVTSIREVPRAASQLFTGRLIHAA